MYFPVLDAADGSAVPAAAPKTEPQQTLAQNKQNQKWKVPHISFPSKFGIISQMITFWQAITRNSQDKVSQYIVRSPIQCDIKHANILC